MTPEQALGDSRKEKLPFNRKKPQIIDEQRGCTKAQCKVNKNYFKT